VSRIAVAALALSLGACARHRDAGPGAPCEAVGAKFASVARTGLAADKDLTPDLRTGVDGLIAPMRDGLIRACKDGAWDQPARDCFANADDERAMKACYGRLSSDQRAALDRAAAGQPGPDESR
jgi:hypothetical protein